MPFRIREETALVRYRFGLRTADVLVCRNCGVYLGAVLTLSRGQFATLNVNTLREPLAFEKVVAVAHDEESAERRQQRREQRWTPIIGAAQPGVRHGRAGVALPTARSPVTLLVRLRT